MGKRIPGSKPIIKNNLKSSDRISVINNNKEVEMSIEDFNAASGVRGYKVYTALLTQTGTSAPTAVVLENTLDDTVTYAYASAGLYEVIVPGYDSTKTVVIMPNYGAQGKNIIIDGELGYSFRIGTLDAYDNSALVNGYLTNTPIEIRIYN